MDLQDDISPVQPDDIDRVVEVWEASVRATHHFLREGDIEFFTPLVHEHLSRAGNLLSMRDGEGRVAGFLGVSEDKIEMLFVHPDWFGRGIGGRLLRHAVEVLGATVLDVNEQNEQAVRFYLNRGFEVEGRSERDGAGKPYPLLHMRLRDRSGGDDSPARG